MAFSNKRGGASSKKRSRVFNAKWAGVCKKCNQPWTVGAALVYEDNVVVHDVCPRVSGGKSKGNPMEMLKGINVPQPIESEPEDIIETIETKVFTPSVYQQSIFDWVLDPVQWALVHDVAEAKFNAVVEAVAGSGKTTTIVKAMELMPTTLRILFLAFNVHIVKELKRRLRKYDNIRVSTVHSLGRSIIVKLPDFKDVDGDKVNYILDEFWPITKKDVPDAGVRAANRNKRYSMRTIIGMVKATLTDYNDPKAVLAMIDHYDIELEEQVEQEILERLPYVMEKSIDNLEIIDFNDMPYLPQVNKRLSGLFDEYDFILIDEAQDLNECNTQLILKCLAPGGRIIAVGDRHQSMYGWAGANVDSIPRLIERLNAQVLPLSISYRCPRSHVEAVKDIVPQIEPAETAKEGVRQNIKYKQFLPMLQPGDMVLCRTNAPLIKPAFELIRKGVKAVIRGKDIGKELVNFVERFNADSLPQLEILMTEYVEKETERLINKGKEMAAEAVMDKFLTVSTIMHECRSVVEVIGKMEMLFDDEVKGVVFSSIHKSKGLEAERIFLLHEELLPHPKAKEGWQKEQEWNIKYVAGTRSLDQLYIVANEID